MVHTSCFYFSEMPGSGPARSARSAASHQLSDLCEKDSEAIQLHLYDLAFLSSSI
jgi:hypothetical protein